MSNQELVPYLGRQVPKQFFRVFIYNASGDTKLVNSYEEFKKEISTGIWFSEPYVFPKPAQVEKKTGKK